MNIDDDVLYAVKERARRERRSAGEVISELARKGLQARSGAAGEMAREIAEGTSFYGFEPLPHRGPAVSNELINALKDEELD